MIISHRHSFIFFHLQKTAGSSMAKALCHCLGKEDEVYGYEDFFERDKLIREGELHKHSPCYKVRDIVGDPLYKGYYKFAFVRNPYDTFVSLYHWWQKTVPWDENSLRASRIWKTNSFSTFCERYHQIVQPYDFLYDKKLIGKDSLQVDFVGRFENLNSDFGKVCEAIGIPRKKLEKTNSSSRAKNYRVYYDEESIQHIKSKYKRELKAFNYKF